jgi:hypothetical protein
VAALCTDRGATSPPQLILLGTLIRFASSIGGYVPTVYSPSYLNGCGVLTLSQAAVSPGERYLETYRLVWPGRKGQR